MPTRLRAPKRGAMLINTSRGGLIDTEALIDALRSGQLGGLGARCVRSRRQGCFSATCRARSSPTTCSQRLMTFPNVIVTGHQAFFTREAMTTICETTLQSVTEFETGRPLSNEIRAS